MSTLDRTLTHLSDGMASTGLLTDGELARLLRHASGFPALPHHRLFLEYRLDPGLRLEGYGHGFEAGTLSALLASCPRFAAARPVADAVAGDPFAADRLRYLDLDADTDPDWIEYDYAGGGFSDAPGVFFSFPARFRSPPERLDALQTALGALVPRPPAPDAAGAPFWEFLRAFAQGETAGGRQAGLYRLGLCGARQPGWVRVVVNGLARDSLDAVGSETLAGFCPDPVGWMGEHLRDDGGEGRPRIAASVTVVDGAVQAVDLECPYFNALADPDERRVRAADFCRLLRARGLVSPAAAETLARASAVALNADGGKVEGLLLLDHFKFGAGGATLGRVKVYFELLLRTRD